MKKKYFFLVALIALILTSCKSEDDNPNPTQGQFSLGWAGNDNPATVPTSIASFASGNMPSSCDLSNYFPPTGSQGNYGTCVAWSVGYNTKTATEAIAYNMSQSDLFNYQLSPKDLFLAIPDNRKSANCNGTNFSDALDVLQSRGIASMATVPYDFLGDCSTANSQASWASEASQHKIEYYRRIDLNVSTIKEQIANKIPVMLGVKVYSNFESWNSAQVYSSFAGTYRGLHALTIVGYDDSYGGAGAFKILNSWGTGWGTNGYIWVDYNFLVSQFCSDGNVYIMANGNGGNNPPDPQPNTTGVDLATWVFSDYSNYTFSGIPNERIINFDIYNIGTQVASSSSGWALYYLYYNAYNANDYGILFSDQFNTATAPNTINCPSSYFCNINFDIPAGSSFGTVFQNQQGLQRTYYMPPLNGYYYLVLYADAMGNLSEQNEQNNIFYTTNQYPKAFMNGYSQKGNPISKGTTFTNRIAPNRQNLFRNFYNSSVNESNRNAYTPKEILNFLKKKQQTGELQRKVSSFKSQEKKYPYKN